MKSINRIIIVGSVAADPEPFTTKSGKVRVTFPVSTSREATSDSVKKEITDYHRVVCWGKLGEIVSQHVTMGKGVYVEGQLLNRAYEKDGERRYTTEIHADEINLLTWRKKGGVSNVSLESPEPAAPEAV